MAFVKIIGQGFQLIPQGNLLKGENNGNDTVPEILNEIQERQHLLDIELRMLYRLNTQPWSHKPRGKNHTLPSFCAMYYKIYLEDLASHLYALFLEEIFADSKKFALAIHVSMKPYLWENEYFHG